MDTVSKHPWFLCDDYLCRASLDHIWVFLARLDWSISNDTLICLECQVPDIGNPFDQLRDVRVGETLQNFLCKSGDKCNQSTDDRLSFGFNPALRSPLTT